jgi:hypothetical protein
MTGNPHVRFSEGRPSAMGPATRFQYDAKCEMQEHMLRIGKLGVPIISAFCS